MLASDNRLKKRKEFAYLYNNGKAKHTSTLTLVYLPTKNRKLKVGFSIGKKIGKAHTRNLIKRRLRMCVREIISNMKDNFNVVFIAKAGITELNFPELSKQVKYLVASCGLFENE